MCLLLSQARLRHDLNTIDFILSTLPPNAHLTSDPHLLTFLPLRASVLGLTSSVIRFFQVVPSQGNFVANCMTINLLRTDQA